MWIAVLAALGSALLVAVASVLQHRAGRDHANPSLGSALRSPLWLAGSTAGLAGFALHAVALSTGVLALVQPLLVTGLLFALPLSCLLEHRRLGRSDAIAMVAVVAGLATFQLSASPTAGHATAASGALAGCLLAVGALAVSALVAARRLPAQRASWLGLSTGAAYGLTAALLKTSLATFTSQGAGVLTTWPVYAFVVVVTAAIVVNQLAFNAGRLAQSLPLITIIDPLVAITVGAAAFGETPSLHPLSVALELLAFAVISVGVLRLARSSATSESADPVAYEPIPQLAA